MTGKPILRHRSTSGDILDSFAANVDEIVPVHKTPMSIGIRNSKKANLIDEEEVAHKKASGSLQN